MAKATLIKATPVVQPPDMVVVEMTVEQAQIVRAFLGKCVTNGTTTPLYVALSNAVPSGPYFHNLFEVNQYNSFVLKGAK